MDTIDFFGYVYCIYFPNGKKYIGQTTRDISNRLYEHINSSKNGSTLLVHKSIRKYGENHIICEEIDTALNIDELNKLEKHYIQELNTYYENKEGYNMTLGGDNLVGYIFTEQDKIKMSSARKKYFSNQKNREKQSVRRKQYYEKYPEEKEKMSNIKKDFYKNHPEAREEHSKTMIEYYEEHPEAREKMSKIKKEYHQEHPEAGETHSKTMIEYYEEHPEAREKMSKIKKEYHQEHPEAGETHSKTMIEYFSNQENREKHSTIRKKYLENPENRLKISVKAKEYYANNPEAIEENRKRQKEVYEKNPEKKEAMSKIKKELHKNNPELGKKHSEKMRLRSSGKVFNGFNKEGELIGEWNYVPDCKKELFPDKTNCDICGVLSGRKKTCYGYTFVYK